MPTDEQELIREFMEAFQCDEPTARTFLNLIEEIALF